MLDLYLTTKASLHRQLPIMYASTLLLGATLLARALAQPPPDESAVPRNEPIQGDYTGSLRPQLHFSPPSKFMNDPNGLHLAADGTYHMYYQCEFPSLAATLKSANDTHKMILPTLSPEINTGAMPPAAICITGPTRRLPSSLMLPVSMPSSLVLPSLTSTTPAASFPTRLTASSPSTPRTLPKSRRRILLTLSMVAIHSLNTRATQSSASTRPSSETPRSSGIQTPRNGSWSSHMPR